ncbi:MAG: hypothetical protein PHU80_03615, partial [Kiritimatiellae bacterium]|nr:hypothetical protein [Kiritimatiellia bacterium]
MLPNARQKEERADRIVRYRQEAERLRGLPLVNEVSLEKESREDLLSAVEKELEKPENRVFLDDTERLMRSLRVLESEDRLRD